MSGRRMKPEASVGAANPEVLGPEEASGSEILLYATEDGRQRIQVRLEEGTVWLSQKEIAGLYQVSKQNVSHHLRGVFQDGELVEGAVVKYFLTTASDGKRYRTKLYNLDAILAVGYRVRSPRGVQFRQWATERLREYLVKGFALDDERLKEGYPGGRDYFDELLERIRDIRSSEKVLYRHLRDVLALAVDYGGNSEPARRFFQLVQNKMHYAATGHTAPELIRGRADAGKDNMGLTSWTGSKVTSKDVTVAKNYLREDELDTLNRIVGMFLEYAEFHAKRRENVHMADWERELDRFLDFNELPILDGLGRMSKDAADRHAKAEYDTFAAARRARWGEEGEREWIEAAYAEVKELEGSAATLETTRKARTRRPAAKKNGS